MFFELFRGIRRILGVSFLFVVESFYGFRVVGLEVILRESESVVRSKG